MPAIEWRFSNRRILLPVLIFPPGGTGSMRSVQATGLIDTGASCSAISSHIVAGLGLAPYSRRLIKFGDGERLMDCHLFRVGLFQPAIDSETTPSAPYVMNEVDGFSFSAAQSFEALIGMDIIEQCEMTVMQDRRFRLHFG